jgi:hypothetical protein
MPLSDSKRALSASSRRCSAARPSESRLALSFSFSFSFCARSDATHGRICAGFSSAHLITSEDHAQCASPLLARCEFFEKYPCATLPVPVAGLAQEHRLRLLCYFGPPAFSPVAAAAPGLRAATRPSPRFPILGPGDSTVRPGRAPAGQPQAWPPWRARTPLGGPARASAWKPTGNVPGRCGVHPERA